MTLTGDVQRADQATQPGAEGATGRAWVVRAGRNGEAEASNLELGRASIGWSEVPDMSALTSRERVQETVDALFPDASAQSRGATTGQLWAFRASISVGDLVVLPLVTQPGMLAVGRCIGGYGYDPAASDEARHYLPVRWQPEFVPRAALKQDFLAMVNGARTVFSVSRNGAAERLEVVARDGFDPGPAEAQEPQAPVRRWLLYRAAVARKPARSRRGASPGRRTADGSADRL